MQIHKVSNHPIHDASKVLPENNDDVLVYFGYTDRDPLIGTRGYYSHDRKKWQVADDECDAYSGEKYREISGTTYKVYAWSKLPEIVITA